MTIQEAVNQATIQLKIERIEEPKQKARLLMQFIWNQTRQYIIVFEQKELTKEQEEAYFKAIGELIQGKPLQYITGQQEFMKMKIQVNEKVLIPRADTENLVEEVIQIAKKNKAKKILDLCTGSGAIAISLAKYIEKSQITATDISKEALSMAKLNAKNNQVEEQINFVISDLFEKLPKEPYDMIVSNPPYIKREIIKTLDKEVQKEPMIALDGGTDGLAFYRSIICQADQFLKKGGYLCFEIGYDQKKDVIGLIKQKEQYKNTYVKKDLNGNDRVIVTKKGKRDVIFF